MSAVKITEGIYSVGIQNPNMRVFDIVMKTDPVQHTIPML